MAAPDAILTTTTSDDLESSKRGGYPASVQSGIPKLSPTPKGWRRTPLGAHLHEIRRPASLESERQYTLVTVKRSRGGVEKREVLRGSEVKTPSQYFIEQGDFLISKRQIVHGACGLVPAELGGAVVSNEYAVLGTDDEIDLGFLRYLSETKYFQQTCFHSSVGVHIEKMLFRIEHWLRWPFNIPPLAEQQRIAGLLNTWDCAIAQTDSLLLASRMEKQALMKLVFAPHHPADWKNFGWKRIPLGEIVNVDAESLTNETSSDFEFRYISLADVEAGKISSDLSLYKFSTAPSRARRIVRPGDILMSTVRPHLKGFSRTTEAQRGCIASTGFAVLSCREGTNSGYVYHYLYSDDIQRQLNALVAGSNYPAINSAEVEDLLMNAPSMADQERIVSMLDAQDDRILALERQIDLLVLEKRVLMQQLLAGGRRVRLSGRNTEVCA